MEDDHRPTVNGSYLPCQRQRDPSTFSGDGNINPGQWLKEYERVSKYNRWDETMKLANVVFYLNGTAGRWFDNNEESLNSWRSFEDAFRSVFGLQEDSARRAEEVLKSRAQKAEESSESYIQEILSLCHQREFYKKVEEFNQFSQAQKNNYNRQIAAIKEEKIYNLLKLYETFKFDVDSPKLESEVDKEKSVSKGSKHLLIREQRKLQEAQHLQAAAALRDIQEVITTTIQLISHCHQRGCEVQQELGHLLALKDPVAKLEMEVKQPTTNFSLLIPKLGIQLEQAKQLQQRIFKDLAEPTTISARKEYFSNSYAEYQRLQNLKKDFEKQFAVLNEPAHSVNIVECCCCLQKKFKFELHKATCQAVNSISDRVVGYCISRLRLLLMGNPVDTWTGKTISVNDHPAAVFYCKYLIAKTIVSQGEEQVVGQPQTASPIAKVLLELWFNFPDLGDLTRAFFYDRCPHLVPYFPRPQPGQSDEDYLHAVGYHISSQGLSEKEDAFLKRMGGLATLYATVLTIDPLHQREHPFGLQHLWQWLQETLSLDPLPDITATVLIHILEVAAVPLYRVYHHQFVKLLHCLNKDYFPRIKAAASQECGYAPVKRLEDLLEKLLRQSSRH
ncbi:GLE1 [Cordylochernes scorpioides]|uniref:mRNA export factor GLE1 n=1 Tax=Cordylochernes scorpioides TaxID=51811 RepID=A0ABY6KJ01_9ARAC|nr:GLE1 [Cordylochernes scorpioides]